jgi:hypothetical protein
VSHFNYLGCDVSYKPDNDINMKLVIKSKWSLQVLNIRADIMPPQMTTEDDAFQIRCSEVEKIYCQHN